MLLLRWICKIMRSDIPMLPCVNLRFNNFKSSHFCLLISYIYSLIVSTVWNIIKYRYFGLTILLIWSIWSKRYKYCWFDDTKRPYKPMMPAVRFQTMIISTFYKTFKLLLVCFHLDEKVVTSFTWKFLMVNLNTGSCKIYLPPRCLAFSWLVVSFIFLTHDHWNLETSENMYFIFKWCSYFPQTACVMYN